MKYLDAYCALHVDLYIYNLKHQPKMSSIHSESDSSFLTLSARKESTEKQRNPLKLNATTHSKHNQNRLTTNIRWHFNVRAYHMCGYAFLGNLCGICSSFVCVSLSSM